MKLPTFRRHLSATVTSFALGMTGMVGRSGMFRMSGMTGMVGIGALPPAARFRFDEMHERTRCPHRTHRSP